MKIWVVGHPFEVRRWCSVLARTDGNSDFRAGLVWAEWNDPPIPNGHVVVPTVPAAASDPMSNVDPLIFGPRMFFDYCKKGRRNPIGNLTAPNSLSVGDLVLFACRKDGKLFVDTVFAIGDTRDWPESPQKLPDWDDVGVIAERVHFHPFALQQHPEVHDQRVVARSYRGAQDRDDVPRYCWVPVAESTGIPFELESGSAAWNALQAIYPEKDLLAGIMGAFSVASCDEEMGSELFKALIQHAKDQRFGIGTEIQLLSSNEVICVHAESEALLCGQWKHCSDEEAAGLGS